MKNEKSLTVVEVLTVIIIVGILASVSLIGFNNYKPSIDLNGSSRELISDLRYAQQLSVSEQVRHGIQFFQNERKYQLIRYGTTQEVLKERTLPEDISFQSITGLSGNRVRFNPYGASEENGTVVLVNSKNITKIIQIKPSGFVKL